jgi:hypothetical protein
MSLKLRARRALFRVGIALGAPSLLWAGCLKTLGESLMDDKDAGAEGPSVGRGIGAAGGGRAGKGGTGVRAAAAVTRKPMPPDSGPGRSSRTRRPNTPHQHRNATPPQIIAADDIYVFRTTFGSLTQLSRHPARGRTLVASTSATASDSRSISSMFVW